jgi:hypothetical protein
MELNKLENRISFLATTASIANLIDQERDALSSQSDDACLRPGAKRAQLIELQQSILLHSARELRNESAGAALAATAPEVAPMAISGTRRSPVSNGPSVYRSSDFEL